MKYYKIKNQACEINILRKIDGITRIDKIRNEEIPSRAELNLLFQKSLYYFMNFYIQFMRHNFCVNRILQNISVKLLSPSVRHQLLRIELFIFLFTEDPFSSIRYL